MAKAKQVIPFNSKAVERAAKVPAGGKRVEMRVEGVPGLVIDARPSGATYRYVYWARSDRKQPPLAH